jgi:hypothetical protein
LGVIGWYASMGEFMRHWQFASLLSILLFSPGPAAAQDQPPAEAGSDIVVTGTRNRDQELRDFVGALTPGPGGGQLSRFASKICPTTVGVSPAQKKAVVTRMKRVAEAVGIDVGGEKCIPNVLVVVTNDKKAFIEALSKKHRYYFGEMSSREVRRLIEETGPASAWHVDGPPLTADGEQVSQSGSDVNVNRTIRSGSRLTAAATPQFAAAAVVVEAKSLEGLTTTQLADYAAMRVFARTDPSRLSGTAPTILKALETPMGSPVPVTMTEWDLAFLKSFYAAPGSITAAAQRSQIRQGLKRELERTEAKN